MTYNNCRRRAACSSSDSTGNCNEQLGLTAVTLALSRFEELISSAQDLGIPRYGLPEVSVEASEQELRDAMEHVALVISSYLSADI
jgi:hypothetical protein